MDGSGISLSVNDTPSGVCSDDTPVHCLGRTVAVSLVLGGIAAVTVVGNAFVIAAYASDPAIRRSVANVFILNLSVADLVVGLVCIPLNSAWVVMGGWRLGRLPCQLWLALDYAATNAAVITVLFISLDRYWLVTKKLAYGSFMTRGRAAAMNLANWAVHALLYTLVAFAWAPLAGVTLVDYSSDCELEPHNSVPFVAAQIAVHFAVPLAIIAGLNAKVYANIRRRARGMFRKGVKPSPFSWRASTSTLEESASKERGRGERSSDNPPSLTASSSNHTAYYSNTAFNHDHGGITLHLDDARHSTTPPPLTGDGVDQAEQELTDGDLGLGRQGLNPKGALPSLQEVNPEGATVRRHESNRTNDQPLNSKYAPTRQDPNSPSIPAREGLHREGAPTSRRPCDRKGDPLGRRPTAGRLREQRAQCRELSRHRKAAVTLSVLVGVFVAMWLPFYVVSLYAAFCQGGDCVSDTAWEVVNYLLWCNSTINPFLYALLNVRFRRNFLRFMGLGKRCSGVS